MLSDLNLVTLFVDGRRPLLPSTHNTAQHVAYRPFLLGGRLRVCLSETSPMERPVNQGVDCPVWSYAFTSRPPLEPRAFQSVLSFPSIPTLHKVQGALPQPSIAVDFGSSWHFALLWRTSFGQVLLKEKRRRDTLYIHIYVCMYD